MLKRSIFLLLSLAAALPAFSQEVQTLDGHTYSGAVSLDGSQLVVQSPAGATRINAADINHVTFAAATQPAPIEGLEGEYFDDIDLKERVLTRLDSSMDMAWTQGIAGPGVPIHFSARWTGTLTAPYSEKYTLYAYHTGGLRVWINDKLLVDQWAPGSRAAPGRITLPEGKPVPIRIEYFNERRPALLQLHWSSPSLPLELLPASRLRPPQGFDPSQAGSAPGGTGHGAYAEYFYGHDMDALIMRRIDPSIDFDWMQTPDARLGRYFSARWTAHLTPMASGTYRFSHWGYGGFTTIVVDGKIVYDNSLKRGKEFQNPIALQAGKSVNIQVTYMNYTPNGSPGEPHMKLLWATSRMPAEVVPAKCLTPATPAEAHSDERDHGLRGEYFTDADFKHRVLLNRVANIDFRWNENFDPRPPELSMEKFYARWSGFLTPPQTGKYTLFVRADRHMRIFLDGKSVLDDWKQESGVAQANVTFQGGHKYEIKVEFNNDLSHGDDANTLLSWSGPDLPNAPIDTIYFSPPASDPALMPEVTLKIPDKPYFLSTDVVPLAPDMLIEPNDHIKRVEYLMDGTVIGSIDKAPYTMNWEKPPAGCHHVAVRLVDDIDYITPNVSIPVFVADPVAGLPKNDWAQVQIGEVKSPPDRVSIKDNVCTISSGKGDIWDQDDDCHYVFHPMDGDGRLIVHVASLASSKPGIGPSGAGIVLRDDLSAGSRQVSLLTSEDAAPFPQMTHRDVVEGDPQMGGVAGKAPVWLKVERSGRRILTFTSTDAFHWASAGEVDVSMDQHVLVGLVVAIKGDGTATAVFDHINVNNDKPVMATAGPGVLTVEGSFLAGEPRDATADSVRFYFHGKDITLKTADLARLLFRPLTREIDSTLPPRQPGVILATGDFAEGEFFSFDTNVVSLVSVIFGPRRFENHGAITGIVLRDAIPSPGYEIATVDGSIYRADSIHIDKGELHFTNAVLGDITLTAPQIVKISKVK